MHPVDILALQELTRDTAAVLDTDATLRSIYPYGALDGQTGVAGVGLLSRYPLASSSYAIEPARQEVVLLVGSRRVALVNAHPLVSIQRVGGLPVGLDPSMRDAHLHLIREHFDALTRDAGSGILIGDFNTESTEPAFEPLSHGLVDAHRAVGVGPGWTWRPSSLEWLGTGLLRIDHIFTGEGLTPVRTSIACPEAGDHCLLEADLGLVSEPGG
jgi:endonuclease/exonuclease/phosphatase (EEP) superfamily protein YafD